MTNRVVVDIQLPLAAIAFKPPAQGPSQDVRRSDANHALELGGNLICANVA